MKDSADIRDLLRDWDYDPENHVRIVPGKKGHDVLQVRLPLGIEQYELDGRPDGRRPHNKESALDSYLGRLEKAKTAGEEDSYRLSPAECSELFEEGVMYYCRYLHLFELKDWMRVARDTTRNLRLFDIIHTHAQRKEDRQHLEQWRPYVLRMNAVARAMLEVDQKAHDRGLRVIREAIAQIESLPVVDNQTFRIERERSIHALRETAEEIEKTRPLTELETLERDLRQAVETQEFERAAILRDKLRALRDRVTS